MVDFFDIFCASEAVWSHEIRCAAQQFAKFGRVQNAAKGVTFSKTLEIVEDFSAIWK
jgi:hypothetical protein